MDGMVVKQSRKEVEWRQRLGRFATSGQQVSVAVHTPTGIAGRMAGRYWRVKMFSDEWLSSRWNLIILLMSLDGCKPRGGGGRGWVNTCRVAKQAALHLVQWLSCKLFNKYQPRKDLFVATFKQGVTCIMLWLKAKRAFLRAFPMMVFLMVSHMSVSIKSKKIMHLHGSFIIEFE